MKEDVVYLLAHLTTEFLNVCLVYTVIFGARLTKRCGKWIGVVAGTVGLHLFVLFACGLDLAMTGSFFSMVVIPAFLFENREKKFFILYPFVVVCSSVIGVCISFLMAAVTGVSEKEILENRVSTIVCQLMSAFLLLIWKIMGYKRRKETLQVHLDSKQYLLLYSVAISEFFMLAPIQSIAGKAEMGHEITVIGVATSASCIVLIIVTLWQGVVVKREIQSAERNSMLENYLKLQKSYYSEIANQDEKMRQLRHDLDAHMVVLQAYCKDSDDKELKQYIDSLLNETKGFEDKSYTGIKGIDAIIRNIEEEARKKQIEMEIKGSLPECLRIEEFDFCTIISNLLKNAVEACEKIKCEADRRIELITGSYNDQIYISVKNTVWEPVEIKDNQLFTSKEDKRNHGIGCENVVRAANKYDGMVTYSCEDGWFIAEVSMQNHKKTAKK